MNNVLIVDGCKNVFQRRESKANVENNKVLYESYYYYHYYYY